MDKSLKETSTLVNTEGSKSNVTLYPIPKITILQYVSATV